MGLSVRRKQFRGPQKRFSESEQWKENQRGLSESRKRSNQEAEAGKERNEESQTTTETNQEVGE